MTPAEHAAFDALPQDLGPAVVSVEDLKDRSARTLLYGYNCERHTWHVYLDAQGTLHKVVYGERRDVPLLLEASAGPDGGCANNDQFVPDKRLYLESCDKEFCELLHRAGVRLAFTTHDESAHVRRTSAHGGFAGRIREEFDDHEARFIFKDTAHPAFESSSLAQRCLLQAAIELQLPNVGDENGIYLPGHLVPALNDKLDEFVAEFRAEGKTPSSDMGSVLEELRWLAGTLEAHHGDAVRAADTSLPTGVVSSRLHLNRQLTKDSFNRHTGGRPAELQDLGAGAFRVRNLQEGMEFVVLPASTQDGTYSLYWKQFGSEDFFQSQYQAALEYLKKAAPAN